MIHAKTNLTGENYAMSPRVTVLMAVYNGEVYLRQAIDSILAQTYQDFEFLIINDGSTDNTASILGSYNDQRIRVVNNDENIGLTRSLNKGLGLACAELIARQDADDISHPSRLEKQIEFMDSHSSVVLLGTQARYINEKGRVRTSPLWWKATTPDGIKFQSMFDNPFFHTSVIFRREVIWGMEKGYDEMFLTSQDFELWSRLLKKYCVTNLKESLVDQRCHSNAISRSYSSKNAHRVEQVFRDNLESLLEDGYVFNQWPQNWIAVTNPGLNESFLYCDIQQTVEKIYKSFMKNNCHAVDVAEEVALQYSSKIMLMARLCSTGNKLAGIFSALKTIFICPKLAARELPRTIVAILLKN